MIEITAAGSLPKPDWLAEPEKIWAPWRQEGDALAQGQEKAALEWIRFEEDAAIDVASNEIETPEEVRRDAARGAGLRRSRAHGGLHQLRPRTTLC